jgi:hypothetical protein
MPLLDHPVGLFGACKTTTGFRETRLSAAWKVFFGRGPDVAVQRLTRVVPRLDDQSLPFLKNVDDLGILSYLTDLRKYRSSTAVSFSSGLSKGNMLGLTDAQKLELTI